MAHQTDVALSQRSFRRFPLPLAGWNASCSRLCSAALSAREVSGAAAETGKQIQALPSMLGRRAAAACKWRSANKYGADADRFQLRREQRGALERASRLEREGPGLKSHRCHLQSAS